MRLGVSVGIGCAKLHNAILRDVRVNRIEFDEIWQFVGKKRRQVTEDDPPEIGDQYAFLALDGTSKAIIAHRTGKRDYRNTRLFLSNLRERVFGAPEISADAFRTYPRPIGQAFGANVHFGTIEKPLGDRRAQFSGWRFHSISNRTGQEQKENFFLGDEGCRPTYNETVPLRCVRAASNSVTVREGAPC